MHSPDGSSRREGAAPNAQFAKPGYETGVPGGTTDPKQSRGGLFAGKRLTSKIVSLAPNRVEVGMGSIAHDARLYSIGRPTVHAEQQWINRRAQAP